MTQLSIQDSILQLLNESLANSTGAFSHTGDYTINGTLTVDAINVKNQAETTASEIGEWIGKTEPELNGKGFTWTWGDGNLRLGYRTGGRLWTSGDMDVGAGKSYKIDNITVLSARELGPQIRKSNLTEVGELNSLVVNGPTELGGFAYFSDVHSRLGINTSNPNGNISVFENNIEVILHVPNQTTAHIGTHSNHNVAIVTDNTERLVVKNSGEVVIGNETFKNGVLRVNGTLQVDTLIAETRIERSSPVEFKANAGGTVYGKGLVWIDGSSTKQLLLRASPDRIWSSEHIDLSAEKSYYINGHAVISETGLGPNVTKSNLTKVGALESLTVTGSATIDTLNVAQANLQSLSATSVSSTENFVVNLNNNQALSLSNDEIILGNKQDVNRPVRIFGKLSVGISNPDTSVDLAVKGNISFANKRFVTGNNAPTSGAFNKGDICWNSNPGPSSYIGWVCVTEGAPGQWLPFGLIAN